MPYPEGPNQFEGDPAKQGYSDIVRRFLPRIGSSLTRPSNAGEDVISFQEELETKYGLAELEPGFEDLISAAKKDSSAWTPKLEVFLEVNDILMHEKWGDLTELEATIIINDFYSRGINVDFDQAVYLARQFEMRHPAETVRHLAVWVELSDVITGEASELLVNTDVEQVAGKVDEKLESLAQADPIEYWLGLYHSGLASFPPNTVIETQGQAQVPPTS